MNNKMERIYYGSKHGKSQCDSLGGIVKNAAQRHVKSRAGKIRNAKEFYDFCCKNLVIDAEKDGKCCHKRRVFFYEAEIDFTEMNDLVGVKGTQKLHQVRPMRPGVVQGRPFACYCDGCLKGQNCENSDTINRSWGREHALIRDKKKTMHRQPKSKKAGKKTQANAGGAKRRKVSKRRKSCGTDHAESGAKPSKKRIRHTGNSDTKQQHVARRESQNQFVLEGGI